MRKMLCIAALLLAISYPAHAGEIPNPPAPQPVVGIDEPPQTDPDGEPTPTNTDTEGDTDVLTEIVFALLASLLP